MSGFRPIGWPRVRAVDQPNGLRVHDPVAARQGDGVRAGQPAEHDRLDVLARVQGTGGSHFGEVGCDLGLEGVFVSDVVRLVEQGLTSDEFAR